MNQKEWKIEYRRPAVPQALREAGYGPLLAAVLCLRGMDTAEAANAMIRGGSELLHDPFLMKGMDAAVKRLRLALQRGETLAVYGDYDVDGITATCLLTDYFRYKGLRCFPYIPDRNEEGYGLNCSAMDSLAEEGVSLLITVDCGITAVEEAEHAKQIGLDMIVTDHHECKSGQLPDAAAVIDCKQAGDSYPNPELAGVGVAMKLACAIEGGSKLILERYSDLVALGTVADVMPLRGENRFLVREGLQKLEHAPRPGFSAMMREASLDPARLSTGTIGFSLAPRLNAAGRLGQASKAAELLMCEDEEEAARLAAELCELNRQRQSIETEIWQEAQSILSRQPPEGPIVLASDRWHQGVIGIAASRLAEQFGLPAIMICLNGDHGKGSCRSYGGFNLYDALNACSEHLIGFGGHALAAGLNLRRDKVDDFRRALQEYYRTHRPEPQPELRCDLMIADPGLLTIPNVRELDLLEPYGSGNPKPVFLLSDVTLELASDVGNGRHFRMRVRMGHSHFDGIFFGHTYEELGLQPGDRIDLAFTPQINEFRGSVSVQLLVCGARRHDPRALCAGILEGDEDVLWALGGYYPQRADFVRVWRRLEKRPRLPEKLDALLSGCPGGMPAERYCLCLKAFQQCGLLRGEKNAPFGAVMNSGSGKADLEKSPVLCALRRETQ